MEIRESDASRRIECFCARKPLLARAGQDSRSKRSFVWIKVVKNGSIVTEVILTSGTMHVRCRECFRFHKITVVQTPKLFDIELIMDGAAKVSAAPSG